MSRPLTAQRLSDIVLGSVGRSIEPNAKLDQLIKMLGTWSGADKCFGLVEYIIKILIPFLHLRARLQHKAGKSASDISPLAANYSKAASLITDARTVFRSWGFLPIIRWLQTIERNPPQTTALLNIERLQGLAMLPFCALDTFLFLVRHGVIPVSFTNPFFGSNKITINPAKLGSWAGRFWLAFVSLQLLHLREDYKLLVLKERSLRRQKAPMTESEKQDLSKRWWSLYNDIGTNLAFWPLALNLAVPGGAFTNPHMPTIFGFLASFGAFRGGWAASALPPAPPPTAN